MISVEEARQLVREHCHPLAVKTLQLEECFNKVLATDILSPIDLPSFAQSAMDGYAIRFDDLAQSDHLSVSGEVQAGSGFDPSYTTLSAVRIFTGAPVPAAYDTIVIQEHCRVKDNQLFIDSPNLKKGSNVRLRGSEIKTGDIALPLGTHLTAGAIGYLRGSGIKTVDVIDYPNIHIIVTGKELVQAGSPLQYGQIYESNSITLQAALEQLHFVQTKVTVVDDDPELIKNAIEAALTTSDLLLLTGGVSVGDYDFVTNALKDSGVDIIFHRVKQKPGKPLLFGKTTSCIVFGLPGNPSSVLTCFYQYVSIALAELTGRSKDFLLQLKTRIGNDFQKSAGLTHFLKGNFTGESVQLLPAQESFRLSSFAIANCLIEIPAATTELHAGDEVTIHLLPI